MEQRIQELEIKQKDWNEIGSQKRVELGKLEAEVNELRKEISDRDFTKTEEHKELQELLITKRWLEIYRKTEESEEIEKRKT